jgi:predicted O-linked N-acetylglucosamine transferase (SPINDLY family)
MSDDSFISLFGQIDLNLDSLGWSGCNTSLRAMMMGCPTITYASELMRGRHTTAILKLLELSNCVAASPIEYINLCLELCNNPQQLLKIKRHILSNYTRLFNDDSCIKALDNFLKERIYSRKLNSIKN